MRKPVIVLTFAYTAGLLLGHGFLYFPISIAILAVCSLVAFIIFARLRGISVQRFLLFTLPSIAGFAAYLFSVLWLPADHYTRLFSVDRKVHVITGRVASALDRDPDRTAFVLEVREIDGIRTSGRVRTSVREAVLSLGYDDLVRVSGKPFQPGGYDNPGGFDYPGYLARNSIYRSVSVRNGDRIQVLVRGSGVFRSMQDRREKIRQAFLASTSGPGSAILQAMVLGEEGGLTDEIRDRFLAAGVTHIISISGSHLGMVSLLCFGLIRLLLRMLPDRTYLLLTIHADPGKIAACITLPLVLFYTLLAGGQIATVRSLMMIGAGLAALILDRESALLHALATAALAILIASPQALFDISFQLSFVSVLGIGSVVMLWKEIGFARAGALRSLALNAVLLTLVSLSAGIVTGPLVVRYFNQFSFAGTVSNLIVVPFAGMAVVPLGLFSGILSLYTHSLPFAALNQFLADSFIACVTLFSRLPFAELHPPSPGIWWLFCCALFLYSLFKLLRARLLFALKPLEYSSRISKLHVLSVGVSSVFLIAGVVAAFLPEQRTRITVPDVGQGDSALIQLAGGKNILIDGGGTYDGRFDIGRRLLAPFLWNRGVRRLDLVVLSHPHPDHMNGLKFILKKFRVGEVWTHGRDTNLPGYDEFRKIMAERKIKQRIVASDSLSSLSMGEADIEVLHPAQTFRSHEKKKYASENDSSLVVRISVPRSVILFTGDIGTEAEKAILNRDLKCDVLKVPHHGSRSSSSASFVEAARPSIVLISVGRGNRYRHPSPEVLDRYERIGAGLYRTDRDGAVSVTLDPDGPETMRWNNLKLSRVVPGAQGKQERENWKRVWIRKWEL